MVLPQKQSEGAEDSKYKEYSFDPGEGPADRYIDKAGEAKNKQASGCNAFLSYSRKWCGPH